MAAITMLEMGNAGANAGANAGSQRPGARFWRLLACIGAGALPGVVGSQFGPGAWYAALDKPSLTPPGWVFPVVWTALYLAMGVALFLFLDRTARSDRARRLGLGLFVAQLVLNGAWSWLFFGLERPGLALFDIVALWALIAATMAVFTLRRRAAAALLAPYLAWVSFATYLNFEIWRLNG